MSQPPLRSATAEEREALANEYGQSLDPNWQTPQPKQWWGTGYYYALLRALKAPAECDG